MTTTYSTKQDIIDYEILPALGEYADDYDVEAIADRAVTSRMNGLDPEFALVDEDGFWGVVADCEN